MILKSSWDDGCREDLCLAELLDKYNIPATFYIPSAWRAYNHAQGRIPLTTDNVLDLSKRFEIGSHGTDHKLLTRIPIRQAFDEIFVSQQQLMKLLQKPVTSFCYPRGYANDHLRDLVRRHYTHARNTLVGSITSPEDPVWESTSVHVGNMQRKEYQGTHWLIEARRLYQEALDTPNSVFHMWGHSWELSANDAWEDLETFFKEIA